MPSKSMALSVAFTSQHVGLFAVAPGEAMDTTLCPESTTRPLPLA